MCSVSIDDGAVILCNGVFVTEKALRLTPERLYEDITFALAHETDMHLLDAWCGGRGPLLGMGEVSKERYLQLLDIYGRYDGRI